jgi:hypothetical protein
LQNTHFAASPSPVLWKYLNIALLVDVNVNMISGKNNKKLQII